uniref:NADH dehydrogenase subunit 6 n=1 Tax=Agonoscena pistaciae TaxID=1635299 RepID=A0A8F2PRS9_9HEMI|nr:NADH dehydrogenase subunit 6 [Agonoscena pistaciae]
MLTKTFSWILVLVSSTLSYLKTPLELAMAIFTQCFVICGLVRLMIPSSWIPLTIFMVTVGGLMIIFMYTTSITSNSNFHHLKVKKIILCLFIISPMMTLNSLETKNDLISGFDTFLVQYFKMFLPLNCFSTLFVFSYLILVLMILISLLDWIKGPMRKKY